MGGRPPFANGNSMSSLRDHAEGSLVRRDWASGSRWERCSSELRGGFGSNGSGLRPESKKQTSMARGDSLTHRRPPTEASHPTPIQPPLTRLAPIPLVLLLPGHLDPQLPRSHDVRLETTRGEGDFPPRTGQGVTDIFGEIAEGQSPTESARGGQSGLGCEADHAVLSLGRTFRLTTS
jgi:hypothetical protein